MDSPENFEKIAAIFLISTPSQGAPAAIFLSLLPNIAGKLVVDLQTKEANTHLQTLEKHWQSLLRRRKDNYHPRIYGAYETKKIKGLKVVPEVYTATTYDEEPIAENCNHINIVKPKSIDDSIYKWVRGRIADLQKHKSKAEQNAASFISNTLQHDEFELIRLTHKSNSESYLGSPIWGVRLPITCWFQKKNRNQSLYLSSSRAYNSINWSKNRSLFVD